MPAILPFGFYQGARSEYLATYVLSRLCAVAPVPRESDFGIDLICHLATREGTLLKIGAPFSVQVKSDVREIAYPSDDDAATPNNAQVRWLLDQAIPLFVAIVDRTGQRVKVFSTWWLTALNYVVYDAGQESRLRRVILVPGNEGDFLQEHFEWNPETGLGTVFMGGPILDLMPSAVEDTSTADELAKVLSTWVLLEWENYVNKQSGVRYVRGHHSYRSNAMPGMPGRGNYLFVTSGERSLPGFRRRLAEVATITGLALDELNDQAGLRLVRGTLELTEPELERFGRILLDQLRRADEVP